MKNKIKIIIAVVVGMTVVTGFLSFNYLSNDQIDNDVNVDDGSENNSVVDNGEYINEKVGFSVIVPDSYKFYSERNDVILFYGGGPIGDDIGFEHETEVGKNIIINHVDAYNDSVFEIFEEYHKSDQYLVEEVVDLAWNAKLVRHHDGVLLIMKAVNTNQYFEFIVYREGENTEDMLMMMYESFKML